MSQPKHISEVLHQLVLNNPNDPYAQILRHCPFMQIELLKEGYMTLGGKGTSVTLHRPGGPAQ